MVKPSNPVGYVPPKPPLAMTRGELAGVCVAAFIVGFCAAIGFVAWFFAHVAG